MTKIPANMPWCAREQSTEKWWAFRSLVDILRSRFSFLCSMPIVCFHISYKMTAQINEYSMVHGNRKGDAFCTSEPIMFVRRHSTTIGVPDARFTISCTATLVTLAVVLRRSEMRNKNLSYDRNRKKFIWIETCLATVSC